MSAADTDRAWCDWQMEVTRLLTSSRRPPNMARVRLVRDHPWRWGLPAVAAFFAGEPRGVRIPRANWPKLLSAYDAAVVSALA